MDRGSAPVELWMTALGIENKTGIGPQGIGVVGMLLNFGVTIALTPMFPPPSSSVRDMIESIREPEGAGEPVDIDAAPRC